MQNPEAIMCLLRQYCSLDNLFHCALRDPNDEHLPIWPPYNSSPAYLEMRGNDDFVTRNGEIRQEYCKLLGRVNS